MPFILLLVAAIFIVSAFNNTQATLATALEQDVPPYIKWAAALAAVGALGYIPGMRTISRYLLALVLVVIFLRNYQAILAGFTAAAGGSQPLQSQATPAAQYVSSGGGAVSASSINPVATVNTASLVGIPSSLATATQYAQTTSGALIPVEATGNVNAYGNTAYTTNSLPFGQFDPANYSGTALNNAEYGYGGIT